MPLIYKATITKQPVLKFSNNFNVIYHLNLIILTVYFKSGNNYSFYCMEQNFTSSVADFRK